MIVIQKTLYEDTMVNAIDSHHRHHDIKFKLKIARNNEPYSIATVS